MEPFAFFIIFGCLWRIFVYIYEHFYKINVDVNFVTINDSNCNCYVNKRSRVQCGKENKNCASKMMAKIISKIANAKNSIDVAMYNFTNSDLAEAILHARKRGVVIRIIVDKSADENEDNHSQVVESLKTAGIDIRVFGISDSDVKKLMHHKFCVIDHALVVGTVITGSLNWTYAAFKQCENVTFISNVPIQKQFKVAFNDMWCNSAYQN